MELNEREAGVVVDAILSKLIIIGAADVLAGIDESRRLGIEEPVGQGELRLETPATRAEIREVGSTRRRPLTNSEMLTLVMERLHQRLVVIPAIARSLGDKIGEEVEWKVDTEFVSQERSHDLAFDRSNLHPRGSEEIQQAYKVLRAIAPGLIPEDSVDGQPR